MALDSLWATSFPDRPRPAFYSSDDADATGFLPITDASDFLVDSLASLTPAQIYSLTANNADALSRAQKEWTDLERLAQHVKTRDPLPNPYKDPQELPRQEIFEERKEANLYNYKYEPHRRMLAPRFTVSENVTDQEKFDCREPPEPFSQGGFIPNDKQYKALMTAARLEGRPDNPDNQKPYAENFWFRERPAGTWIAKALPQEAPPPPRTRAREAQLNGTASDRATRFNGEKVPPTRGLSSAPLDAPSPESWTASPIGSNSPAMRKRKIEVVDITGSLPRKKHPNQYTKRREAADAARLVTAQEEARANGISIPTSLEELLDPTPAELAIKKKHPNQHTKRREREEAERQATEVAQRQHYFQDRRSAEEIEKEYLHDLEPSYHLNNYYQPQTGLSLPVTAPQSEKKKQPNQYTKRREREEAERLAALQQGNSPFIATGSFGALPSAISHFQGHNAELRTPSVSTSSRAATPLQGYAPPPPLRDFSHLSKEELRKITFKDHELRSLLYHDHSWLNDDSDKALAWKTKILNSEYPVRTWAMLKKWREWRQEGKDKRPRDKDGNRIRDVPEPTNTEDVETADVESGAAPSDEAVIKVLSPVKRPTRLRIRLNNGLDSPQAMPSSPLIHGVNARDLDAQNHTQTTSSFSSNLRAIDEVDTTTKVDSWQDNNEAEAQTQTEYAATTNAGKGVLIVKPKPMTQETGNDLDPSTIEVDNEPVESEDPLHGDISSPTSDSTATIEVEDKDTTYRSGTKTNLGPNGGNGLRRTRSTISTKSVQSPSLTSQTAANTKSNTKSSTGDRGSPVATRRSGLRPNPPKRTVTNESFGEIGMNVTTPTRRSLRNVDRNANGVGRRSSLGN